MVLLLVGSLLIQACSGAPTTSQPEKPVSQPGAATAAAPPLAATASTAGPTNAGAAKRGGVLRLTQDRDPGGLDIQKITDVQGLQLLMPLYSQIIRQSPNNWNTLEGDLATKWEASNEGKTWTFTIRNDAKWHDGTPVTPADIVYNLNRMVNPPAGFKGGNAGCLKETVSSVGPVGDAQVAVQLKAASVSFLQCVAMAYIRMLPKHIVEPIDVNEGSRDLKQNELVGSGPFKLQSYQSGSSMVMVRNADYYVQERPYLDGVTYYFIPDLNSRLAGLRSGQLDLMRPTEPLTPSQVQQLQGDMKDGVVIKEAENARLIGLFFNTQTGPFQDIRVRRATHLAVDRQAMTALIQEGQGLITPPLCSCWEYIYDQNHYLTLPGYRAGKDADLKEAKRLVDEATGGKGIDVVITVANLPPYPDYVQLIQQQVEPAGIRVTIQPMENAVAQQRYADGQFEASVHPGAVPFLDPDSMITRYFLPKGDRNWARWENKEFNDLYLKESVIADKEERGKVLRRMADILQEELPVVGLSDSLLISPMSNKVRGLDRMPSTVNADLRFDWVWFE